MARAVFRCDAGPSIGAGHAMRCLATAETLAWASWDIGFVSSRGTVETVPALARAGFPVADSGESTEIDADVVVFDHYGLDAEAERRLAGRSPLRVAFDDMPIRAHDVDVLVDPTPGRNPDDYRGLLRSDTELLAGVSYAQLRHPWRAARDAALRGRRRDAKKTRVLVSMGATDPANATVQVLRALSALDRRLDVDVVLGPGAPHRAAVHAMMGAGRHLHIDPANLPQLVADADLAIGAAGSSCFERACLGLPAIIVVLADNQVDLAEAFDRAGAARAVPRSWLESPGDFARVVLGLLDEQAAWETMSARAAALVDGRGPQRLLARLAGRYVAAEGSVRLRAAEQGDGDWMHALHRQSETGCFTANSGPLTAVEFSVWIDRFFNDPDRLLAIVEYNGVPVGVVCLDRLPQERKAFEMSVVIIPEWHDRGIGEAALALVRKLVPSADLITTVLAENRASQALFERAGYRREAEDRFRSVLA